MNIKLGNEIQATISGSGFKRVCCEQCSHGYEYAIEREGTGEGFAFYFTSSKAAKSEAEERAARDLRKQLQHGHDVVPCPECGHVQSAMVEEARENPYNWLTYVAIFPGLILIYTLPFAFGAGQLPARDRLVGSVVALCAGVIAFGSAYLQAFLRKRFNPNIWPLVVRLEIARTRCLTNGDVGVSAVTTYEDQDNRILDHSIKHSAAAAIVTPTGDEDQDEPESVSSADQANGLYFFIVGLIPMVLGLLLFTINPGQWRPLAAFGLGILFWVLAYKFSKRKT